MSYEQKLEAATAIYNHGLERVRTTPVPEGQKFPPGARVRVNDPSLEPGSLATVMHTYAHAFGGDDVRSYCLDVDEQGSIAWIDEDDIEAI